MGKERLARRLFKKAAQARKGKALKRGAVYNAMPCFFQYRSRGNESIEAGLDFWVELDPLDTRRSRAEDASSTLVVRCQPKGAVDFS